MNDMYTIHNPIENEKYTIAHRVFKETYFTMTDPEFSGQIDGDIITVLYDKTKKEVVMSDSVMEKKTNADFIDNANGHVLVAGLGLGMIILAIQDKPEVESITVVEISQDLFDISMIGLKEHLNSKVKIVISDIHDFISLKKYDTIYCDIWNDVSGDNYNEMFDLRVRFQGNQNKDNKKLYVSNWRELDTCRLAEGTYDG